VTAATPAPAPARAPRTRRGAETRAALVAAARTVFERDGFLDARIADVAAQAGVATGSFYTHFADKEEILAAVLEAAREEMLHPHLSEQADELGPAAMIEAANRAYLASYRKNAKLMALLDQVAAVDVRFRRLRAQRSRAFVARNARAIARLQAQGLADPALDPRQASRALSGMVSRLAYATYVLGERAPSETLVQTLTRLWVNALRIPPQR